MTLLTFFPEAAHALITQLAFDRHALLPAIAVQHDSGEVLMQAWMNQDAVLETLTTGRVCYYSRSRASLWRKGETSGHIQTLVGFRVDCDKDSILLLVEQTGAACHTNRHNCYFHEAQADGTFRIISEPL
jgi:phosphoribosyl-AMP cyclohydrolase